MRELRYLIPLFLLATSGTALAQNSPPPACPFKAAELQAAFGVAFAEGQANPEMNMGEGIRRDCRYASKDYTIRVGSTFYPKAAPSRDVARSLLAGKLVPIANDPDGAAYQEAQGDATDPAVHYVRGPLSVELRILGTYYKDLANKQKDMLALREKLARLRRFP